MDASARAELTRLLARLADGDRAAFEPLFAAVWPLVRGFAVRALAGSPDAEDAAQEALLKVFARACEFDPRRDALSFILGVAAWEIRTVRARSRRRREELAVPDGIAPGSPEDALLVQELLGGLSPEDARTLAAALGGAPADVPAPTFRKRLSRALLRLRRRHADD